MHVCTERILLSTLLINFGMFIFLFFFNDTATTEIYTLSLHDALPIWGASYGPGACLGRLGAGGCDSAWGGRVRTGVWRWMVGRPTVSTTRCDACWSPSAVTGRSSRRPSAK